MKNPLFIVLLIQTLSAALLPGNMSFGQCEPCQSWHVVVFNTDVQIAQPADSSNWPGWAYLKNHCVLSMRNAIRGNETTKSREVVTSFTRSFKSLSDIGFRGTDVGKNAGFQGFSPLSMIVRSFETKKRKENPS